MLILMMGDLYKKMEITRAEMDSDFPAQVIYGGHYWAPKWDMNGVVHGHTDEPDDPEHAINVLDMWSFMEEACERLSAEEKAFIVQELGPWATDVKFSGFDGNEESGQMQMASFLVEKMGRCRQCKGRGFTRPLFLAFACSERAPLSRPCSLPSATAPAAPAERHTRRTRSA